MGDVEGGVGGGDAAVYGGLEKDFLDFVAGDAVVESGAEMETKFFATIEGDEHGDGEHATSFKGKAGA
jgi:hypothetical protein